MNKIDKALRVLNIAWISAPIAFVVYKLNSISMVNGIEIITIGNASSVLFWKGLEIFAISSVIVLLVLIIINYFSIKKSSIYHAILVIIFILVYIFSQIFLKASLPLEVVRDIDYKPHVELQD